MLIRYGTSKKGRRVKIANIYTSDEHGIKTGMIDSDALKIIKKLRQAGYSAYVVGGAVRDLLLDKKPKDYDIATDAHPRQIRKLFWNSKVIGKRFRLVHIHYGEKIIEVSTFRGSNPGDEQNIYGTLEDDVKRRDFSFNALYYSPFDEQLLDYIGGFEDVRQGVIRSIIPLDLTFREDPVRLIRTVKYASSTGFALPGKLRKALRKYSGELEKAAVSRLTEELMKMLASGCSAAIFRYCDEYGMLKHIVPFISENLSDGFFADLEELDAVVRDADSETSRELMLYYLTRSYISEPEPAAIKMQTAFRDVFKDIKRIISPLTPPNAEVEKAAMLYMKEKGIKVKSGGESGRNRNRRRRKSTGTRRRDSQYKPSQPKKTQPE